MEDSKDSLQVSKGACEGESAQREAAQRGGRLSLCSLPGSQPKETRIFTVAVREGRVNSGGTRGHPGSFPARVPARL